MADEIRWADAIGELEQILTKLEVERIVGDLEPDQS